MANFQARQVLSSAVSCVAGVCSTVNCSMAIIPVDPRLNASQTVRSTWESLQSVCNNMDKWVANPDIVGPGVLIAYMAQAIMGLLAWVVIASWSFVAAATQAEKIGVLLLSLFIPRPRAALLFDRLAQRLRSYNTKFNQANPTAILRMSLVEFQESQCFFIVATQFALHMARRTLASNFSSNALWFGFLQDENSAALLAVCSVLPMILIQVTLARCQLNSFYTLVLSSATLALSFATRLVAAQISQLNSISQDQLFQLFDGINLVLECGGRTSPRTFCGTIEGENKYLPSGGTIHGYNFLIGLWIYAILHFLLLLLWAERLRQYNLISSISAFDVRTAVYHQVNLVIVTIANLISVVLELITVAVTVLSFTAQIALFDYTMSQWSIGQFVAVTVFAPVVYKWIVFTVFRVKKGIPASPIGEAPKAHEDDIPLISTTSMEMESLP